MKSHLRAKATFIDGEYYMEGDSGTVLEITERITAKARKMLNPFSKPEVQFNEEWKFFIDAESRKPITKEEFLREGGAFEYLSWSDYAGGNRFEVEGGIGREGKGWRFTGYGRFG